VSCGTSALPPTLTPTTNSTAASGAGLALRVQGSQLVNQNGQATRLIGVNTPMSRDCALGTGISYLPSETQAAQAFVNWHANAVRVALNEDCWLGINGSPSSDSGSAYRTAIVDYVDLLHSHGLYAIIDLHANAPGTYLATSPQVMADEDHAPAYWQSVAETFKGDPATVFEPYNEPHITTSNALTNDPWSCWLNGCTITETDANDNQPISGAPDWQSAGMQQLVDVIRSAGATNVVSVGGLNWSEDESKILQYLPNDPLHQLTVTYHDYMSSSARNTSSYWDTVIAPVARQLPVLTTEFGEKDRGSVYNAEWMDWADQHGVSYLAWWWMVGGGSLALISSYDGTPTSYGRTLYDHYRSL
jgi:hypothetical protein